MRTMFTCLFALLIVALLTCARVAHASGKPLAKPVGFLLLALVPPVAGNLVIIFSTDQAVSTIGCYTYYLGMNLVMFALLRFVGAYCHIRWPMPVQVIVSALLVLDATQLLVNVFTGHAFRVEEIMAYGEPYYRLVPLAGQTFHRIVDYGILAAALVVIAVKMARSSRYDAERYVVLLAVMVFTTVWQTAYIFSRTPIDRSMIGFGTFGLLVFYFSLYYRPLRLLDRMLATVASEIPDALFFFDSNGHCIWLNKRATELLGIGPQDYHLAQSRLEALLGTTGAEDANWSDKRTTGTGDDVRSFVLEHRVVVDGGGRGAGSFLTVRDNSTEEKRLQQEIYNSTHDSLTQLYNRAGYELLLSQIDLASTVMLIVDGDEFKLVNDRYGHEAGDKTLKRIARALEQSFRSDDRICRIGGDEFLVLMRHAEALTRDMVRMRVNRINAALGEAHDGLPPISVSAGIASGRDAATAEELFERADRALYETKRAGRGGLTFYSDLAAAS